MKLGLIISGVIVLAVIIFMVLSGRQPPDPPTKATTAAGALDKVEFPTDLPRLYTPQSPNNSADAPYKSAVAFARENAKALTGKSPQPGMVFRLSNFVIDGLDAGQVSAGLLDDQIPMTLGEQPEFGDALTTIGASLLKRAEEIGKTDKTAGAKLAIAVTVFGERLFRSSVRLHNRLAGASLMRGGVELLYTDFAEQLPQGGKELEPWIGAIKKISTSWNPKILIVTSVQPHMGDLLNIAKNDKDVTFRVEATRWMGIAKYLAKTHKGNLAAVEDHIAASKRDTDSTMVAAATAAEALTHEQFKKLR